MKFQAELGRTVAASGESGPKVPWKSETLTPALGVLQNERAFAPSVVAGGRAALQRRVKAFLRSGLQPLKFVRAAVT
jgi:hypothetical protein